MNPWTLHRWRGCLLGTGGGLILMIVLGGFYTWMYLHHTAQVRAARATETSAQAVIEDSSPTAPFELPADGLWTAVCRHRDPQDWAIDWTLSLNLRARSFDARAKWTRQVTESDGWLHSYQLDHEGLGSITEDGMLEGSFREVTTLVFSQGGVVGAPQVTEREGRMYGAISADLKSICISRGEDPGNYDIDHIRRIGRGAFFGAGMGCEAECTISTGP
jgi:hypothetical protein